MSSVILAGSDRSHVRGEQLHPQVEIFAPGDSLPTGFWTTFVAGARKRGISPAAKTNCDIAITDVPTLTLISRGALFRGLRWLKQSRRRATDRHHDFRDIAG